MPRKSKFLNESNDSFTPSGAVESFKISPRSVFDHDPMNDGYESFSLSQSQYLKDNDNNGGSNGRKGNPYVVEGFGKRVMYKPNIEEEDLVPNSNRVVPGMPNAIRTLDGEHAAGMIITDADIRFKTAKNNGDDEEDPIQVVSRGRPVLFSQSIAASTQSSRRGTRTQLDSQFTEKSFNYDPSAEDAKVHHDITNKRCNDLMRAVTNACDNIKAPVEAKAFQRNEKETRNLAFAAVPFMPWQASKMEPCDVQFDPSQPYVPKKVDFSDSCIDQNIKGSIYENNSVLNQSFKTERKVPNFNRVATGYGQW
jgi:hypothetical protein